MYLRTRLSKTRKLDLQITETQSLLRFARNADHPNVMQYHVPGANTQDFRLHRLVRRYNHNQTTKCDSARETEWQSENNQLSIGDHFGIGKSLFRSTESGSVLGNFNGNRIFIFSVNQGFWRLVVCHIVKRVQKRNFCGIERFGERSATF